MCLNDALMQGPHLINDLVGVLIRFRKELIAVTGDIRAMFHQVKVHPKDVNALRFLWWPEGNLNSNLKYYRMVVHLCGATSSPACASFCLRQVVKDFGHMHQPLTSEIIIHNFYVDDCLASFSPVEEANSIIMDLIQLLQRGEFHLTKWASSSSKVLLNIPKEERSVKLENSSSLNFQTTYIMSKGFRSEVEFER